MLFSPNRQKLMKPWTYLLNVILLLVLPAGLFAQPPSADESGLHVAFSSDVFAGLNMTDARNTIKALTASLAREHNLPVDTDPMVFETIDEAEHVLQQHAISAVCMTTRDYWLLRQNISFDQFLMTIRNQTPDEIYVLLTAKESSIKKLSDLKGKNLIIMTSPAMDLATVWLDVELAKIGLPQTAKFVGKISEATKPAKVVLPVFFGQSDACLITQRSFATMVELNPQVGLRLRIVATSPGYVPALFGFRSNLSKDLKQRTILAFGDLPSSIVGRQTLTLFQTEAIIECPVEIFGPSLALLSEHARVCPEASAIMIASLRGHPQPNSPVP